VDEIVKWCLEEYFREWRASLYAFIGAP